MHAVYSDQEKTVIFPPAGEACCFPAGWGTDKGGISLFRKEISLPCTLPEKIHIASEQFEEVRRLPNRLPARGVAAFASAIRFGLLLLSAAALLIL